MDIDWLEPEATARGSVIVVAGRGEHAHVYRRFARRIAFDGYRVAVVENDPAAAARVIADAESGLPLTVVGSDSGALTALDLAATQSAVSGVVAAGLLVAGTDAVTGGWDGELEIRSACPVHRSVLAADGALDRGTLGAEAPVATADSLTHVQVPVLVVHGGADVLSPVADVLAVTSALPGARVVVVNDGRHDILNDVSHRSVAAEIVQFLERLRLPGTPDVLLRDPAGALAQ
ncbi:alpha/beta hydrolase [Rhodococcus sp. USK10]|uniref:alpha/beta hydrolase n=1 Tax=Rhodococcus sp. USK10 TaxID=2789739 RepID=UPI001C5E6366|nr:alpha/beta hydrolase [Rhodococcus sp. USK10]QYB05765.1 alpha/beta hydrolase [Rhodococcus sp. USK10]